MDNTYPPEAWRRLGKTLEKRRGQLGYGYRQRGNFLRAGGSPVSEKTLARLERGERGGYPDGTIAALEALYRYEPGSFEAILRGGQPVPVSSHDGRMDGYTVDAGGNRHYFSPPLQRIWEDRALDEPMKLAIIAAAERERQRRSQERNGGAGEQFG